jgi:sarcosine oxidase subunit beta
MRDHADVVVIGGGIMGLGVAYHLARDHGQKRVTVVERSYLCSGASGRNGGGVRAQWSTETNVRLMQEALRRASFV